jgi:hypothetical protein
LVDCCDEKGLAVVGVVKIFSITTTEAFVNGFFRALVIFNWVEVAVALCAPGCLYSVFGHDQFEEDGEFPMIDFATEIHFLVQ